jgi:hypothetical protein
METRRPGIFIFDIFDVVFANSDSFIRSLVGFTPDRPTDVAPLRGSLARRRVVDMTTCSLTVE